MDITSAEDTLKPEDNPEKDEKKKGKKIIQLERSRTAFERLQLAWVRTSLTLFVIGVSVYELYYNRKMAGKTPLLRFVSGRELSFFLLFVAFTMLLLATIQHYKSMSTLKENYPQSRFSVAALLSYLVLLLILALFIMALMTL